MCAVPNVSQKMRPVHKDKEKKHKCHHKNKSFKTADVFLHKTKEAERC